jgi:TPR repeat protein
MHLKGAAGFPVNRALAIEFFTKAAALDYPDAKVNLGLIYLGMLRSLDARLFLLWITKEYCTDY